VLFDFQSRADGLSRQVELFDAGPADEIRGFFHAEK